MNEEAIKHSRQEGVKDGLYFAAEILGMGRQGYCLLLTEWERQREEYEWRAEQPMVKLKRQRIRQRA